MNRGTLRAIRRAMARGAIVILRDDETWDMEGYLTRALDGRKQFMAGEFY